MRSPRRVSAERSLLGSGVQPFDLAGVVLHYHVAFELQRRRQIALFSVKSPARTVNLRIDSGLLTILFAWSAARWSSVWTMRFVQASSSVAHR
jgi:hypothetical protein